ncbi:MAG: hypothetical protein OEV08_14085 [Nitrospira sp.]|nr:hypothetical protein [Nitrospira sp.]
MIQAKTNAEHIIDIITHADGCTVEHVALACPELTWIEVFVEINRLRRDGQVQITLKQPGYYVVTLAGRPDMAEQTLEMSVA